MTSSKSAVLLAVANIRQLSGLPSVMAKALRILEDPNTEASEIVSLIGADPALTAGTVQLANSALYGARRRIGTLAEAVHLLGYAELYRVVGFHLSRSLLASPLACYGLSADDYWQGSVTCGVLLQSIAARAALDSSEGYTLGLLHGIGRLAIDQALRDTGLAARFQSDPLPNEDKEPKYTRLTYAEVGGLLLEGWGFPTHVIEVMRCQLEPFRPTDPPMLSALQIARQCLGGFATLADHADSRLRQEALKLSLDDLTALWRAAQKQVSELRASLGPS